VDAILTFHAIDDEGDALSFPARELARLLDDLLEDGVSIVPLDRLRIASADPRPRVALTFDDGLRSVRSGALPLLADRRLPFTVFAVSGFVGRATGWAAPRRNAPARALLDWNELEELLAAGAEIGGHGATHAALRGLDEEAWTRELDESKALLEQRLHTVVSSFAYPYGTHDDEAVRRVGEVYARAVTTRLAFVPPDAPRCRIPRIDAYYLRPAARWRPLFGAGTRTWLALRALGRTVSGRDRPR
jgi:peptidoglycan/xylan/chitin deacetylase (PgdA/CDA1 family)